MHHYKCNKAVIQINEYFNGIVTLTETILLEISSA